MEIKKRIRRLQNFLVENQCDAIIVDDTVNLLYLTGLELSAGQLLVSTTTARLIVDGRYYEKCKMHSPVPTVLQKKEILSKLLQSAPFRAVEKIGFDADTISYQRTLDYRAILRSVNEENPKRKPLRFIPLNGPISQLRMIKDEDEIKLLKKAADLGSKGFDYLCSLLKPGITELEAAAELEIFWKKHGSQGLAFDSIIAFGTNGSMPHYRPQQVKLKKGDPVLIDIGVKCGHYHSDMTRTVFMKKPVAIMEEIYQLVLKAQLAALKQCKPGTVIGDLDRTARDVITEGGYGKNFSHSLGHGVGLEIHEHPFLRSTSTDILRAGMVITVEPGIYLPDIGGVRIEDTVVITAKGHENLTKRPKTLTIL